MHSMAGFVKRSQLTAFRWKHVDCHKVNLLDKRKHVWLQRTLQYHYRLFVQVRTRNEALRLWYDFCFDSILDILGYILEHSYSFECVTLSNRSHWLITTYVMLVCIYNAHDLFSSTQWFNYVSASAHHRRRPKWDGHFIDVGSSATIAQLYRS